MEALWRLHIVTSVKTVYLFIIFNVNFPFLLFYFERVIFLFLDFPKQTFIIQQINRSAYQLPHWIRKNQGQA